MKRRIKRNVWDNWNGYLGTRRFHEFGTDQAAAEAWLATGELPHYDRAETLAAFGRAADFKRAAAAGEWDWEKGERKP